MSAITVGGNLVHYEVLGRGGRPVILLHGWLGSWRYWIPTMRLLQLKYRVYAIDLFGYGDSSKNLTRYTIDRQVELLGSFMEQLGIPKAAIIAHGLGSQVLVEFARQMPHRVARMLVVSAPLFNTGDLDTRQPAERHRVLLTPKNSGAKTGKPLADKSRLREESDDSSADPTVSNASNATLVNPRMIDREKLREAALARGAAILRGDEQFISPASSSTGNNKDNPLYDALQGDPESLLARCFKRSETHFEKLQPDVQRSDNRVIKDSSMNFDPGLLLDTLRVLSIPTIIVHGKNDPLIKTPDDEIWTYLLAGGEEKVVPFPLPEVRHFPMLEADTFQQIVSAFLETPDISKIEIKDRWRRRAR